MVIAHSWLAASQCIWVCWIFLEGWRGGSSAFQVSQIPMCLAGLAGGPGSRWADGHYPASHSQGLSSRLVRALRDEGPPPSDKKVRLCWAASPERHQAVKDLDLGMSYRGGVQHTVSLRMTWVCSCGLWHSTLWSKCQVARSAGKAWNVYAACHGLDQRFWEDLDCRLSQNISVGKPSA